MRKAPSERELSSEARLRESARLREGRCNMARYKFSYTRAPATASGPPFLREEGLCSNPFTGCK